MTVEQEAVMVKVVNQLELLFTIIILIITEQFMVHLDYLDVKDEMAVKAKLVLY